MGEVRILMLAGLHYLRTFPRKPSPPLPLGWPLGWVKQVLSFPEDRFNELRGVDASVYLRFLRGCCMYS